MKEPAKDFNQFSESEQKPNLLSTSADNNENKKPSSWKLFWEAYNRFYDRIKPVLNILEEQKSALHDSIFETFKEIEDDILYDRNSGIMIALYGIENSIRNSVILRASSQRDASISI